VIVVAPPDRGASEVGAGGHGRAAARGARAVSLKEAVAEIAAVTGRPRREIYQRALSLTKERDDGDEKAARRAVQRPRPERQVAFRTGISPRARGGAADRQGFRILARRWRSPVGEIDIVARRRALLVFVEVKARDSLDDAAWR